MQLEMDAMKKLFAVAAACFVISKGAIAESQCIECDARMTEAIRQQDMESVSKEFHADLTRCTDMEFFVEQVVEARKMKSDDSLSKERIWDTLTYRTKTLANYVASCEHNESLMRKIGEEQQAKLAVEAASVKAEAEIRENRRAAQSESDRRAKLPGVRLGMSAKQVREKTSWGEPDSMNRTVGPWGVHEQWVYGVGQYLYFQNGKLTSYQN
jgi:hypothetical protein